MSCSVSPISSAFVFYIYDRLQNNSWPWLSLTFFTLTLSLLSFSDSITYAHITLPLLATLFFFYFINQITRKTLLIISGVLLLSAAIARILAAILLSYPPFPGNYADTALDQKIVASISAFTQTITALWESDRLMLIFLLLAMTVHIVVTFITIQYAAKKRPFPTKILFISPFTLSITTLSVLAAVGTGVFINAQGVRYLYPLTVLPLYTLLPLLFILPSKKQHLTLGLIPFILFSFWQHADTFTNSQQLSKYNDYYPELATCIDKATEVHGVQAGIGGYWDAKQISVLSKRNIQITQVQSDLTPFIWITNPQWYSRFPPQFILFNPDDAQPLDLSIAINRYGYPAEIVACPGRELWLYNRPYDQLFQTDLAQHPYIVNWCQPLAHSHHPCQPLGDRARNDSGLISR